jgi:hypothetical protein
MAIGSERLCRTFFGDGVGPAGLSHASLANPPFDFRNEGGVFRPFQI